MRYLHTIASRLRGLVSRNRLDREFDEELTTHLELLVDEHMRDGMPPAEARRRAIIRLGRPDQIREQHHDRRGLRLFDVLGQDLRYAVRRLRKSPAFTVVVTATLALGIGANIALFSIVDALLLRQLPVRDPDQLVLVQQVFRGIGITKKGGGYPTAMFDYMRTNSSVTTDAVGFTSLDRPNVVIDGKPEIPRQVDVVSDNFFRELGVKTAIGRVPNAADGPVAVLSHRLWRTRFNSDTGVLGQSITIDKRLYSIVGVAAVNFLGVSIESSPDVWIVSTDQSHARLGMIARMKPGINIEEARAALDVMFTRLVREHPGTAYPGPDGTGALPVELTSASKGLSILRPQYERPLLALTGLVTLVLLITCTNVGNLLMVRNTARRRELTIRVALGAHRRRLVLQYFVESIMLAAFGGIAGFLLARVGVTALLSMLPLPVVPEALAFHPNVRTLGFATAVSVTSALLFGLAPAWRTTRVELSTALRSGPGTTGTPQARRLGRSLVASQVGLSVVLLVAAGLFVQTLRNLALLDVGFSPDTLLQVTLDTRGSGYRSGQVGPLHRLLIDRASAIPGVTAVSTIRNPIMQGGLSRGSMPIPGVERAQDDGWDAADVGPSFFETLNIPVVRGRAFTAADFAQNRSAVVISETFATHYFPNRDPVGLLIGDGPNVEIIGIVRDVRLASVRRESGPMMYHPIAPEPDRVSGLVVRTTGQIDAVARALRAEISQINPRLFVDVRTMRQQIERNVASERMVAVTSAFFSLLGLLLVSIGIFGVASYTIAQRTSELGIRLALGATRWSLIREALKDTMLVFGAGLAAGLLAALIAVRLSASFISDLLFGLTAYDAANIVMAGLVMVAVAVLACILPARRATRIDVLTAIREE